MITIHMLISAQISKFQMEPLPWSGQNQMEVSKLKLIPAAEPQLLSQLQEESSSKLRLVARELNSHLRQEIPFLFQKME